VIIVTYVDDMLITGPNPKDISPRVKEGPAEMSLRWMIWVLQPTFVGGEDCTEQSESYDYTDSRTPISTKILKKYGFENCKSCADTDGNLAL